MINDNNSSAVIIINPGKPSAGGISAKSSVRYDISDNTLNIQLTLDFNIFDLRDYTWTLFNDSGAAPTQENGSLIDHERLNWLACVFFNYIGFDVYKANSAGLLTAYNAGDYTAAGQWEVKSHTAGCAQSGILANDFKNKVSAAVSGDASWFTGNPRGRTCDFRWALNCGKFFTIYTPNRPAGFDQLLNRINQNDTETINQYRVWQDFSSVNSVKLSCNIDISGDTQRTYAVRVADPASSSVSTSFIYVSKGAAASRTRYVYVDKSLNASGAENYLRFGAEQAGNSSVKLSVNKTDSAADWSSLHPGVTFKIRKVSGD